MTSLASCEFYNEMSRGQADKIKKFQQNYLAEADTLIKESSNLMIEKRREKIKKKFKNNFNGNLSLKEKDFLGLTKKLTILSAKKQVSKKFSIDAPIDEVFYKLRLKGYVHPTKNKSKGNSNLKFYTDSEIVLHFNLVIRSLLNWFSGANNFPKVKGIAYVLRKSCVLTLANKHKKSIN